MVRMGAVVFDLTSLSEDKFRVLQAQARLQHGEDLCTQILINTLKDTNTITDIKWFMQKILGIQPKHAIIYCRGDLLPDGVQISEMNVGVKLTSGFTLNLNCFFVSGCEDQMNIFFDAVFVSGLAMGLPSLPSWAIDNLKRKMRPTKVESQTSVKRRRISTKGQLNLYPRCA